MHCEPLDFVLLYGRIAAHGYTDEWSSDIEVIVEDTMSCQHLTLLKNL